MLLIYIIYTLSLLLALCVLFMTASSFTALFFGEKSIDIDKLAHNDQLSHIQSFLAQRFQLVHSIL